MEIPTTIVEKSELVTLLSQAEREVHRAKAWEASCAPQPAKPKTPSSSAVLPHPWFQRESRSKPGYFYYVNGETGETTWELPTACKRAPVEACATLPSMDETTRPGTAGAWERKHDYRDDAFDSGSEDLDASTIGPTHKTWSRSGEMTCTLGVSGVRRLSLSMMSVSHAAPESEIQADVATVSDAAVHGEVFTWVRGELIGRGALGRVFKALDQKSGVFLAVKEVAINAEDEEESKFMDALKNEIDILKELKHTHIVSYLGHDYIDGCLYMYLEHMAGGSVTQALQQFGAFEEPLMADYSKQVLDGLEYLHTRSPPVVHRDIKGSNILLGLCEVIHEQHQTNGPGSHFMLRK